MKSIMENNKKPSNDSVYDLDVTPIMNMFVILIPFLVSMAVFTHYSVIEFSLPTNSSAPSTKATVKETTPTTIVLSPTHFEIVTGNSINKIITKSNNGTSLDSLESMLRHIRLHPVLSETKINAVVAVHDGIPFSEVVQVMDLCKRAGFSKVALSESPTQTPSTVVARPKQLNKTSILLDEG